MSPTFSQRLGILPAAKPLQVDSMDEDLTVGLWNVVKVFVVDRMPEREHLQLSYRLQEFAKLMWDRVLKRPVDEVGYSSHYKIWNDMKEWFFETSWNRRYDLLEFAVNARGFGLNTDDIQLVANSVLERESSAWRFHSGRLIPISNSTEMEAVTSAIDLTSEESSLEGANIHLRRAAELLSDRDSRDYRNSVKESIQAVEMIVRRITGQSTLGKGLDELESKGLEIDKQLRTAFEKTYAYSNSKESGIRHAIMDAPVLPDFDDAKYMLVISSAFVNYLVGKARRLGVSF